MRYPYFGRLLVLMAVVLSSMAMAEESSITITSPLDGATLDAMAENVISYDVVQGPKGDHSHLYVDGEEAAILRKLKGSYKLPTLSVGEHTLCIKVVNKGHTPIGVEKCVKVMVQ